MKNRALSLSIILIICIIIALSFFKYTKHTSPTTQITIGILQTASHPALDAARKGFIEMLHSALGVPVTFITQNAEGSIISADTIAHHFHANPEIQLFFVIATPALQAMAQKEFDRPLIFAAVTDPTAIGIQQHERNITGVSDRIDVHGEIDSMHALLPHIKTVALIFNSAELNSVTLVRDMTTYLKAIGITPITTAVVAETDIASATLSALRQSDALLAPTDNMVASSIVIIAQEAQKAQKPLIVSDNLLVKQGALMAQGVDYFALGQKAGEMALEVIKHKKNVRDIAFAQPEKGAPVINKTVLQQLALTVPDSLQNALFVE